MTDLNQERKSSNVTARLKKLLRDIFAFVDAASEEERQIVLTALENSRILALLEKRRAEDRRKHERKPCSMEIDYATWKGAFNAKVHNISDGGMAIQTDTVLSRGQQVTVSVFPPNRRESIRVTAEIVWSKPGAVGLRFPTLSRELKEIIESL